MRFYCRLLLFAYIHTDTPVMRTIILGEPTEIARWTKQNKETLMVIAKQSAASMSYRTLLGFTTSPSQGWLAPSIPSVICSGRNTTVATEIYLTGHWAQLHPTQRRAIKNWYVLRKARSTCLPFNGIKRPSRPHATIIGCGRALLAEGYFQASRLLFENYENNNFTKTLQAP